MWKEGQKTNFTSHITNAFTVTFWMFRLDLLMNTFKIKID